MYCWALCLVPLFVDYESMNFLKIVSLCNVCLRTNAFLPSAICTCWSTHWPVTGWVCQWKPFWIPVDDSFKKAFVEEWVFQVADTSDFSFSGSQKHVIPETPKVLMPVSSSTWGPWNDEDTACARGCVEAPLPPLQPRPTCERLEFPFSCDAVLSGYEDLVSSGSDQFTMWGPSRNLGWTGGWHSQDWGRILWYFWTHSVFLFPDTWRQQVIFLSTTYAEEAQHLQLESLAPAWIGRCYRGPNRGEMAYYYPARSIWLCRTQNPSWTVSCDPLRGLRDSLQQGHFLPWYQC